MPLPEDSTSDAISDASTPDAVPVPRSLLPQLSQSALLLDIDGTLLELAPTPREVWVPPGSNARDAQRPLLERTRARWPWSAAVRSMTSTLFLRRRSFRRSAATGAEMRISNDEEAVAVHAPPMDKELKRRLAAIAKLSPGILLEDKGYSLALHYRLAPHAREKAIYEAVSLIRADLPNAPIEILPGKSHLRNQTFRFQQGHGGARVDDAPAVQKGRRPIFIGDDVTDENAFAVMPDFGGRSFRWAAASGASKGYFDEQPRDVPLMAGAFAGCVSVAGRWSARDPVALGNRSAGKPRKSFLAIAQFRVPSSCARIRFPFRCNDRTVGANCFIHTSSCGERWGKRKPRRPEPY